MFKNVSLPQNFFLGVGVFLSVMSIVILSKKLYEKRKTDPAILKKAATLVQKSAESTFSAQQTNSPLLALTNMNQASAYLNMAREMAKDDELTRVSKIPIDDLKEDVEREQRIAQDKMLQLCPQAITNVNNTVSPGAKVSSHHQQQYQLPQQQANMIRPPVSSGTFSGGHGMFTPLQ